MKDNPPAKADAPMVEKMAKIGVVPGQDFDPSKLDPAVAKALERVPKAAKEKIMGHFKRAGTNVNGWRVMTKTGHTARTTCSGRSSPPSASAPTGRRTRSTRPPKWTATASPTAAPTSTSMHFAKGADARRSTASGR